MKYSNWKEGIFLSRPNRFIAHVECEGKTEICHVKNTGRCKELLIPGTRVILHRPGTVGRKTEYDLIGVQKGNELINMDSQAPNKIAGEWLQTLGFSLIQAEKTYGNSRFDFYLEKGNKKIFAEVKGVTLEQDGLALFPDAPTERGVKHLRELIKCREKGLEAWVIFIIQMKGVHTFSPNWETHPEFAKVLCEAKEKGLWLTALTCDVAEDSVTVRKSVPIQLP
ncbi:MAG: DNA/RNA nuclease SfsA [Ruminococcaceae bacterium]|nr:DNA/RNA nuclease SfsA [Oscillospiraceae bacterium]